MTLVSTVKMTARQFLQLGEDPAGVRLELVNGEVAVSPSPMPAHQYCLAVLVELLNRQIRENHLGQLFVDVDTIFGEYDVRRPDILFFSKARLHLIGEKAMEGPPDLCLEIISPSSTTIDRKHKLDHYRRGGVAHYWIVDPAKRTVEGYSLQGRKYVLSGKASGTESIQLPPFEKLSIPLKDLWRPKA
jgi:Uma2 family endonuclease